MTPSTHSRGHTIVCHFRISRAFPVAVGVMIGRAVTILALLATAAAAAAGPKDAQFLSLVYGQHTANRVRYGALVVEM